MKRLKTIFPLLLLFTAVASCIHEEDVATTDTDDGKLKLSFDLSGSGVTLDIPSPRAWTAVPTVALNTGVRFTVRAYKSEGGAYVDEGIYMIKATTTSDGTTLATGTTAEPLVESDGKDNTLYLTRGEYDLRFLSYNRTDESPTVDASGLTAITNGKDLISTTLRNVLVQADKDGQTDFTISLKGHPFEHLCSCVKATFQIPKNQVVTPASVSEMSITLKNLCAGATYEWSSGTLTLSDDRTTETADNLPMINNDAITSVPSTPTTDSEILAETTSKNFYVLPLDERAPLQFDISMKIKYKSTQIATSGMEKTNELKIENLEQTKALLPGKSYNFIFSLSFYGDYLPADLMLAVQDYVPVNLKPDEAGGEGY